MPSKTWEEMAAEMRARDIEARRLAHAIYEEMAAHVEAELRRTGARLELRPPGTNLPKTPTSEIIAMRMDVTAGTAICARQPHSSEPPREQHRSWVVDLDSGRMDSAVRRGITRVVERVATLQGRSPSPQLGLDLT